MSEVALVLISILALDRNRFMVIKKLHERSIQRDDGAIRWCPRSSARSLFCSLRLRLLAASGLVRQREVPATDAKQLVSLPQDKNTDLLPSSPLFLIDIASSRGFGFACEQRQRIRFLPCGE